MIEGNISGLEGEGWVYLQDAWNGWQVIDSTKAVDGSFRFEIDKPVATNAYMYYNNRIQLHNLLLEPGTIIAKGDIDNAWNTPTYGTPMNDRLKSTVESIMYMDTDSMTMDEIKTIKTKAVREELNTGKGDAYRLYMISSVMDVLSPTELMKYLETLDEELRNCPFSQETKDLLTRLAYVYPYEDGSERLGNLEYVSAKEMLSAVCDCYSKAAQNINSYGIIPCGEAMMRALDMGIEKIHRDTFHASLGAGRYLLALCWYKTLTKKDISNNTFDDFDEPVTESEREIVIKAVNSILA